MSGFESLLPRPLRVRPAPGECQWPAAVRTEIGADIPAEGYRLELTPDLISVRAGDAAGVFHAEQTLRQLRGPDAFRAARIHNRQTWLPCGVIEDAPRFPWRGCLLDVARNFRTKAEVLRFVDLLAAHKLNVLHLHLTDDQGWRLHVPDYPRLTGVGAWRSGSMVGRHDGPERDGRPHGGFYTADDLAEIVAYAGARFVTVVPEIDIPGHSMAAIAAYPELGPGLRRTPEVRTSWGVSDGVLNTEQSTVDFYLAVFGQVLDIFPSPVIGVGGDEVPGVTAGHHRFVHKIIDFLHAHGRRAYGWDELLDAGQPLPAGTIVGSWRGEQAGVTAVAAGHDVVMCPEQHVYLDHRQSGHPEEPVPVGYLRTLEDVYRYEPLPPELPDGAEGRILGAQAQVWTEHLDSVRRVDYATFPRLSAFAEVVWSERKPRDVTEFVRRLREHHLPRLDALGVEYRPLAGPHPWQTRPGVPGRPR